MAFDGGFLYKIIEELREAVDSHIDKIYQPSKEELVFLLRKKGFAKRLLLTVKSGSARLHFTENKYENPAVPPNFCMLLRKYLSSARLIDIKSNDFERIAELIFSSANEMGDVITLKLICELIGNSSNVILTLENGKIIDALKHSDVESGKRFILPGAIYEYPISYKKQSPLSINADAFLNVNFDEQELYNHLLSSINGFSPLICREIVHKSNFLGKKEAFNQIINSLSNTFKGVIIYKADGSPLEYSYTDIDQYGVSFRKEYYSSPSQLLDKFYTDRDTAARISAAAHDIIRLVSNLYSRAEKRLGLRLNELKLCENRENLRINGELLKANLYSIKTGDKKAVVPNYYDPEMRDIEIPLNPALSPQKNADKYFKEYKKTYTAEQRLTALTENDREELKYLDSVLQNISAAKTLSEISEIRDELFEAGYIKQPKTVKKPKSPSLSFKEYISIEGYKILVGKNNIQNDYITTKLASKNDVWFHAKNIAGSHTVVFCGGKELSHKTVIFAAQLAAENSKASGSANVPIDYTPVKYVKKPQGAKPGMVIYTTNKTVYVTPRKEGEI